MKHALVLALIGWVFVGCAGVTQKKEEKKPLTDEERAALYLKVGNGALREGDPTGALSVLLQARRLNPKLAAIHHSLALAYFKKHDLNESLKSVRRAVELSPKYSAANNTMGKLLLDMGRYSEAEIHLTKAAKDHLNRESYKARTNLGILYFRKGDFVNSRTNLDIAIRDAPQSACVAYYYRGQMFSEDKNYLRALKDFRKSTRNFCSGFVEAHYATGVAYFKARKYKDARKKFLEIKALFPETQYADLAVQRIKEIP